jgi:hypothetical protein
MLYVFISIYYKQVTRVNVEVPLSIDSFWCSAYGGLGLYGHYGGHIHDSVIHTDTGKKVISIFKSLKRRL